MFLLSVNRSLLVKAFGTPERVSVRNGSRKDIYHVSIIIMANVLNNLIAVETVLFGIKFVKYDN